MGKVKQGDCAIIIADSSKHSLPMGEKVAILRTEKGGSLEEYYGVIDKNGYTIKYVRPSEIEKCDTDPFDLYNYSIHCKSKILLDHWQELRYPGTTCFCDDPILLRRFYVTKKHFEDDSSNYTYPLIPILILIIFLLSMISIICTI